MMEDRMKIDLLDARLGEFAADYHLDDAFFAEIDGLIDRGEVDCHVECVQSGGSVTKFRVHCEGHVIVPCDRCLSDLRLPVVADEDLLVRLGEEDDDDGEVITVGSDDPVLDLSLPLYELTVLSMPLRRVHADGECDGDVLEHLSEHEGAVAADDESESGSDASVDERWAKLRDILNKDNN